MDKSFSWCKSPMSEHPWRAGKAVQEIFIIIMSLSNRVRYKLLIKCILVVRNNTFTLMLTWWGPHQTLQHRFSAVFWPKGKFAAKELRLELLKVVIDCLHCLQREHSLKEGGPYFHSSIQMSESVPRIPSPNSTHRYEAEVRDPKMARYYTGALNKRFWRSQTSLVSLLVQVQGGNPLLCKN